MSPTLPKKLGKEPLIDAVFEIRFSSNAPAADILPGFLFSKLTYPNKKIEKLPASDIPQPIRQAEPSFQFSPLVKIEWDDFFISIGDHNLVIGCKIPYPGWNKFKPTILEILNLVNELHIINSVQRFSMKYVDIIPNSHSHKPISKLSLLISLGEHSLENDSFSLRVEIPKENLMHIVSISSTGVAKLNNGEVREGIVVDTDTISHISGATDFKNWLLNLPAQLENLHFENKKMFFSCLKDETIKVMEPEYD